MDEYLMHKSTQSTEIVIMLFIFSSRRIHTFAFNLLVLCHFNKYSSRKYYVSHADFDRSNTARKPSQYYNQNQYG